LFPVGQIAGADDILQNEYSKQIKEYRAQQGPGKAHGKVFVKGMFSLPFCKLCAYGM
jgi:hypothetical protein